jgi:hypothetical protein
MLGVTGASPSGQSAGFETKKKPPGEGGFGIRSNKLFVFRIFVLNLGDVIGQAFAFSLNTVLKKAYMRFFASDGMLKLDDKGVDY